MCLTEPGLVFPYHHPGPLPPRFTGRYLYYINIVPTKFVRSSGKTFSSNQYSVTLQTVLVDVTAGRFYQPGVFFKYEISPYVVIYRQEPRVVSRLLLRLVSMCGGVWVVAGWVSSVVHYAVVAPRRQRKQASLSTARPSAPPARQTMASSPSSSLSSPVVNTPVGEAPSSVVIPPAGVSPVVVSSLDGGPA